MMLCCALYHGSDRHASADVYSCRRPLGRVETRTLLMSGRSASGRPRGWETALVAARSLVPARANSRGLSVPRGIPPTSFLISFRPHLESKPGKPDTTHPTSHIYIQIHRNRHTYLAEAARSGPPRFLPLLHIPRLCAPSCSLCRALASGDASAGRATSRERTSSRQRISVHRSGAPPTV